MLRGLGERWIVWKMNCSEEARRMEKSESEMLAYQKAGLSQWRESDAGQEKVPMTAAETRVLYRRLVM